MLDLRVFGYYQSLLSRGIEVRTATGDTRVKQIYHTYFEEQPKEFIALLHYCKTHQICFTKIEDAVGVLQNIGTTRITKDKILTVMDKQAEPVKVAPKMSKARKEIESYAIANLQELSALIKTNNNDYYR